MTNGFKIKSYENLYSFEKNSMAFWEKNESQNSLFWEVIRRFQEKRKPLKCANVFKNGEIRSSFLKIDTNYILLTAGSSVAVKNILRYSKKKKWRIKGVLGTKKDTENFESLSKQDSERKVANKKKLFYIFETGRFLKKSPVQPKGELVKAKYSDWPRIRVWAGNFARESGHGAGEHRTISLAKEMLEGEGIFLFKNQNQCLAMAGFGRRTSNYLVINMVYVPEDMRARGVATNMISEMSFLARRIGFPKCILFSEQNLAKNLYKNMGCRLVGDFCELEL